MKNPLKLAIGSLFVGIVVLVIKYIAYHLTGSVALYSDALESIVNIIAACAVILAVYYSAKPADSKHQYGHYKAEYLSAVVEGIFIIITALIVLNEAYHAYFQPRKIDVPFLGLLINGFATIINGVWAVILIRFGKKYRSPAITADGQHIYSDFLSSIGVAIGVTLAVLTGWLILDVILAVIVALNILWSGWKLVKESVDGLMDAAPITPEVEKIERIIGKSATGSIEFHDLRVRTAGWAMFIDFHLVVSRKMSVGKAHEICDNIEEAILAKFEHAIINIHVEPEEKAKHVLK
jgi:cation diffusion facilitator family transporter